MITHVRTLLVTTMAALWACAPTPEPTANRIEAANRRSPPRVVTAARPCRSDSFFVEVPVKHDNVWPNLAFVPAVKAELEAYLVGMGPKWFCPANDPACLNGAVNVAVESVLPQRAWPISRADGHLRFLRVHFFDARGTLSVEDDWQCDAVAKIRQTVADENAVLAADEFYVGRECDASIASTQAVPTAEMLSWHLTDIGLPPNPVVSAPAAADELVDLAMIDTGVGSALHAGIGVASADDLHPGRTHHHVHGRGMAVLSRQTGPKSRLHDFAALDEGGSGTMADVGVALDRALFGASSGDVSRALVIEMALGFPPEVARAAGISGAPTSCQSYENPAGEIVRYMLDVAARMDRDGDRAVFVSAASGNRPLRVPAGTYPPAPSNAFHTTCSGSWNGTELFYPAQWSQEPTCHTNVLAETHVAFAVGAVDEFYRPTGVQIPDGETPLVAPGQHVYAAHAAAPAMPINPMCGAGGTFADIESLPRAFTGSSVAATLVAGAAADLQYHRLAAGDPALDRLTLARTLYLTGRDLCRTTASGVPVRMLAVDRMVQAVQACPALIACAASVTGTEPIPANTLAACTPELIACGLASTCATSPRPGPIAWDATYEANALVCESYTTTVDWKEASTCGSQCPYEANPERSVVGSLGPQPIVPLCPDCPVVVAGQYLQFALELTADGPPKTDLTNPYVVITGPDFGIPPQDTTDYFALPDDPNKDEWILGNHLEFWIPFAGSKIDFANAAPSSLKGSLVVDVTEPGGKTVTDFSTLDFHD